MKLTNSCGLSFAFSPSGALRSIEVDPICLTMASSSAWARSAANVFLRKRGGEDGEGTYTALLGAESPSSFCLSDDGVFEARGSWAGLDYVCLLLPAASELAWEWRVRVESRLDHAVELDLICMQSVGLKTKTSGLVNESYVSQYLERRVLAHPTHGSVICCRQNMREASGHPWLMLACSSRAIAASTDGLQFYGTTFRASGEPESLRASQLQGELSGESSVVAIQEQPFVLNAGDARTSGFVARYLPDHPAASSTADLQWLAQRADTLDAQPHSVVGAPAAREREALRDRLRDARLLPAEDLSPSELSELFGSAPRHLEEADGRLLSFFVDGPCHVVLCAKETRVDRPHGHIMQANTRLLPDESIMSTTAFACGVFNSHLTQGNTNFNTLLSVCTQPDKPNLEGQRIVVQLDDQDYLLGVPSAFEMGLQHCRWIYKHGARLLQVCTWTSPRAPHVHLDVKVLRGGPVPLWLTHQFDGLNGWQLAAGAVDEFIARPRADSMLASRFPDAQFRLLMLTRGVVLNAHQLEARGEHGEDESSTFVVEVPAVSTFAMSFVGEVTGPAEIPRVDGFDDADARRQADFETAATAWKDLSRGLSLRGPRDVAPIAEALPWYGMNALVHYLTPYGLEQFSGAAWGTRDVCQGPIDLLLCQERHVEAKQVLRILFSHQDSDGGWPQWWMFDRYASVRADGAHGDVIYWCILALCSYLRASGDFAFLDEPLPYFAEETRVSSVSEHVDRIVQLVLRSFVSGTALVQFGGGDWNDSLQPVSEELAQRMISSWTVQMSYQAFDEYREVCERAGRTEQARELQQVAERIHADFHAHLVKDGVVAGYGLVREDGAIEVLLHPSDTRTGVHHSLLPMNRGVISGAFSQEQAEHHLALIDRHLKGPDGARLMDRPLRYHGGPQTLFQRAESSTYFGREIGLMYVHEHLRYAEALARMGRATDFLRALRQAIPVDYREVVPQGDLRQANCYYSSSDVLFRSRYEADERYTEVVAGKLPLKGGWRVYSSGPGIYISHVIRHLLGLRVAFSDLVLDPVVAPVLDGLTATLRFRGRPVTFVYRVEGNGSGPRTVTVNGKTLAFAREKNPYREGGAVVPLAEFMRLLEGEENVVAITV